MKAIEDAILNNRQVKDAIEILSNTSGSQCTHYSKTIPIDNWNVCERRQDFLTTLDEINKEQDVYTFELSGDEFRPDLVITSRKLKATYDAIPKTKTMRDVLEKAYKDFGITSDIGFHVDLDERITDEEYENQVKLLSVMPSTFQDIFDKKFDEDNSDDDL